MYLSFTSISLTCSTCMCMGAHTQFGFQMKKLSYLIENYILIWIPLPLTFILRRDEKFCLQIRCCWEKNLARFQHYKEKSKLEAWARQRRELSYTHSLVRETRSTFIVKETWKLLTKRSWLQINMCSMISVCENADIYTYTYICCLEV